ncbi:hypothetical protein ABIB39_000745 [Mucilaginibacter sp. UYP27]
MLRVLNIITIFVNRLTLGIQLVSMLICFVPYIYNQRQVINPQPAYKFGYDNLHPICANLHIVLHKNYRLVNSSCKQYPLSEVPSKDIIFG